MAVADVDAIVFDFDGVLVQSVDIKTRAFARLFEPHGPDVVARVVAHHRAHGGVSRFEKFRHYYREFLRQPLADDALEDLARRFADLVVEEVERAPFVPGADRFLNDCCGHVPCFVVSGTPQEEMREIIRRRRMHKWFVDVFGTPASKTENVRQVLAHGFSCDRTTLFGDADADWIAARDAGMRFVGVIRDADNPLASRQGFVKISDFEDVRLERAST